MCGEVRFLDVLAQNTMLWISPNVVFTPLLISVTVTLKLAGLPNQLFDHRGH